MKRSTELLLDALVAVAAARHERDCQTDLARLIELLRSDIEHNEECSPRAVYDLAMERERGTVTLPVGMQGRRFRVGQDSGDTFETDDDYDGITLTLEIHSEDEAEAVLAALLRPTA